MEENTTVAATNNDIETTATAMKDDITTTATAAMGDITTTIAAADLDDDESIKPSAKVLGTYELLEQILLHLPLRTLLLSRRVNKAFLDVAVRSQDIQSALFLKSSREQTVVFHENQWKASKSNAENAVKPLLNPFMILAVTAENVSHLPLASNVAKNFPSAIDRAFNSDDQLFSVSIQPKPSATPPWYAKRNNLLDYSVLAVEGFALREPRHHVEDILIRQGTDKFSTIVNTMQAAMLLSSPPPRTININESLRVSRAQRKRLIPPPARARLDASTQLQLDPIEQATNEAGVTVQHLLQGVQAAKPGEVQQGVDIYALQGLKNSTRLSRTVDEITGWEMLELFALLKESEQDRSEAMDARLVRAGVIPMTVLQQGSLHVVYERFAKLSAAEAEVFRTSIFPPEGF